MRSDCERILKLFVEFSINNPIDTKIEYSVFHNECENLIVGNYDDAIDALRVAELIEYGEVANSEGGGQYYKLTNKGFLLLKEIYRVNNGSSNKSIVELNNDLNDLKKIIISSKKLKDDEKVIYLETIDEVEICLNNKCFNASIAMCGKLLEIFFLQILASNQIKIEKPCYDRNGIPNGTRKELTLQELMELAKKHKIVDDGILIDYDLLNLIRRFRNGIIHYKEGEIKPTENHMSLVIVFCISTIKNNLSKIL